MRVKTSNWSAPGADGEVILISTDAFEGRTECKAHVLFAHGFKGYKDYGFIPVLSVKLVEALPIVMHRFNFSHSGMTDDSSTFARPDLFERNTWNKQVADMEALIHAVQNGASPAQAASAPIAFLGHSRGGTTCLLAAGRRFRDGEAPPPVAVATLAASDSTLTMDQNAITMLRDQGYLVSPSARTGQSLRVGIEWLREQEDDPTGHDVLSLCSRISCPVLVAHGAEDPTVPVECAERITRACPRGESLTIADGNHVFNTPNPADPDEPMSAQLAALVDRISTFLQAHVLDSA